MARSRGRGEREVTVEAPPQFDAYTGLLIISLVATLTGLIFVYLDYSDYSAKAPPRQAPASLSSAVEQPPPAGGAPEAGGGATNPTP